MAKHTARSRHVDGVINFYDEVSNPGFPTSLWADFPLLVIDAAPSVGFYIFEDFHDYPGTITGQTLPGWHIAQSNSTGTVAPGTATVGGTLVADSEASTRYDGIQGQKLDLSFIPTADNDIWVEYKFKIADNAGSANAFLGLASDDTTIMSSGDLSPTNCIGFAIESSASGVMSLTSRKAANEKSQSSVKTLTNDTFTTLGFKINGISSIDYYIDGTRTTSTAITSSIPIVLMKPSWQIAGDVDNETVADPILHIDWLKFGQVGR